MVMNLLSRKEELILIAIWKLGEDAYGMTIRDEIVKTTGVKWLFGSIYTPLSKLYEKGLIDKMEKLTDEEHTGRPRVYFRLTPKGMEALTKIKEVNTALWENIPPITIP